jgi:hypothetical protein
MNFRFRKYKQGWIVEREQKYFFGFRSKWVHIAHWSGLGDYPYYSKTQEGARDQAVSEIRTQINHSFFRDTPHEVD